MGKKALRRILRAYSVYDDDLGYCRGMSFIVSKMNTLFSSEQYIWRSHSNNLIFQAAVFLTVMPEEESFWMFAGEFLENY